MSASDRERDVTGGRISVDPETKNPPEVSPPTLGDMDAEAFRRHGQRTLDWIAEYLRDSERYPVMARVAPGCLPRHPSGAKHLKRFSTTSKKSSRPASLTGITRGSSPTSLLAVVHQASSENYLPRPSTRMPCSGGHHLPRLS